MIVTRAVYEAVRQIHQQRVQYDPASPVHKTALDAGVAQVNGEMIELTFKGELVLDL
ncbi:MAG TPA: hypothetical protein VM406_08830 [Noviherbaspirillum sp.]|nr:hypothetical protein [Noviherbaspirillum sp.]